MNQESEFFAAVQSGNLAKVRRLVAGTPVLVKARDPDGATALHHAALTGNRDLARFLVEQGADVNARDGQFQATPAGWVMEPWRELGGFLAVEIDDMLWAIQRGDADWVRRFLVRLPAFARGRDASGKPLIEHAEACGNPEVVRRFREAAAGQR